jgi:hypothetical protein
MAPFPPDLKLNGVNAGILITSSYVDPVGFFRGGNILCSCKINAGRWWIGNKHISYDSYASCTLGKKRNEM